MGLNDNKDKKEPTELIIGANVAVPTVPAYITSYTVTTSQTKRVKFGGSYTFTITLSDRYSSPIVKFNPSRVIGYGYRPGKLNLTAINKNTYTYTISNVLLEILSTDFTVAVSRIQ